MVREALMVCYLGQVVTIVLGVLGCIGRWLKACFHVSVGANVTQTQTQTQTQNVIPYIRNWSMYTDANR